MPQRLQGGFTLIELLVVLVLIGLALAVVGPRVGAGSAETALRADMRTLAGALRLAREQAIREGRPAYLTLDPERRRWVIPGSGQSGSLSPTTRVIITADRADIRNSMASVRFAPDGSSSGGRITLETGSRQHVLRVDWLTGRVASEPTG